MVKYENKKQLQTQSIRISLRTLHSPDERACSYMVLLPYGFVQQPFKNFE
jgi:hypothetical protein